MSESGFHSLSATILDLTDQRRSHWSDQAGLEFEGRFLRPLAEVAEEFHRYASAFTQEVDAALAELGG